MPRRAPSLEDLFDNVFDSLHDAMEDFLEDAREQAVDYAQRSIPAPPEAPQRAARGRATPGPPRTRPAAQKAQGKTLYDVLQVSREADAETISAAYKSLMIRFHPDKGGDQRKAQEITAAYTVLKDPAKRRAYDKTL